MGRLTKYEQEIHDRIFKSKKYTTEQKQQHWNNWKKSFSQQNQQQTQQQIVQLPDQEEQYQQVSLQVNRHKKFNQRQQQLQKKINQFMDKEYEAYKKIDKRLKKNRDKKLHYEQNVKPYEVYLRNLINILNQTDDINQLDQLRQYFNQVFSKNTQQNKDLKQAVGQLISAKKSELRYDVKKNQEVQQRHQQPTEQQEQQAQQNVGDFMSKVNEEEDYKVYQEFYQQVQEDQAGYPAETQDVRKLYDNIQNADTVKSNKVWDNKLIYETPEELKYFTNLKNFDNIIKPKQYYYDENQARYVNIWYLELTYYFQPAGEQTGYLYTSLQEISSITTDQISNKIEQFNEGQQQGSDGDGNVVSGYSVLVKAKFINVDEKQHLIQNKGTLYYQKKKGGYFNFESILDTRIDLTRYQILNVNDTIERKAEINQSHCLEYALKQILPDNEVNQLIQNVNFTTNFSKDNLKYLPFDKPVLVQYYDNELEDKSYFRYKLLYPQSTNFIQVNLEKIKNLGIPNKDYISIGLFFNHYFINEQTKFSQLWLSYYNTIKSAYDQGQITQDKYEQFLQYTDLKECKFKNGKYYFRKGGNTLNSVMLFKLLIKNKLLQKIDTMNIQNFKQLQKEKLINIDNIKIDTNQNLLYKYKEPEIKHECIIVDMDFEAIIKNSYGQNIQHKPFLVCGISQDGTEFVDKDIIGILNQIIDKYKIKRYIIRFFNITYDSQFILKQKGLKITNLLKNGSRVIQFKAFYRYKEITFQDNYLKFNCKLSDLPNMFFSDEEKQNCSKEIFPYGYYTEEIINNGIGDIQEAYKYLETDNTLQEFKQSITNSQSLIDDNHFDVNKYAQYYCLRDCKVQQLANIYLENLFKTEFQIDPKNVLSISSLSRQYFQKQGVLDNVYQLQGDIRRFIQKFVCGGRVMVANNAKYKTNLKLGDFDAVSLYPSAMRRGYIPCGFPQKLSQQQIDYYNNPDNLFKITEDKDSVDQNTLFLTVELYRDNQNFVRRMFPVIDQQTEDGLKLFSNQCDGIHYLTHIRLQDAIKFQGYKYKIQQGIYFSQRDYKLQDEIQKVFDQRKYYKQLQKQTQDKQLQTKYKGLQTLLKLIMNSFYGKTIEKLHNMQSELYSDCFNEEGEITEEGKKQLRNNLFCDGHIEKIGSKLYVEKQKDVVNDMNFGQVGVLILDMSKRIMNEVICLAEDLKIKLFYQDTDSIHIEIDKLDLLNQEFQKKYNRQLIGSNLGQFHTDFESSKGNPLYAQGSLFLVLDNGQKDVHVRLKGIPQDCILKNKDLSVQEIYDNLYNNQTISFNLSDYKTCMTNRQKGLEKFSYINEDNFTRNIQTKNIALDEQDMYNIYDDEIDKMKSLQKAVNQRLMQKVLLYLVKKIQIQKQVQVQ